MVRSKNLVIKAKIALIITSIIVLAVSVITYLYIENLPPIPSSISSQLNFKPVVAGEQATITKPSDFSIDQNSNILRYSQQFKGVKLIISQQLVPEQYIDFPDKLQSTAEQIGIEQTIQTDSGPIFIVKKDNRQTALFIKDSVLILVESEKSFDANGWKEFFGILKTQ